MPHAMTERERANDREIRVSPDDDSDRPLSGLNGDRAVAPEWYRALSATPIETFRVDIEGAGIEMLTWGERGHPGILLAHGSGAHAHWWAPVAPMLSKTMRVVALSYSGMGQSDWRDKYSIDLEVEELFGAAQACGLFDSGVPPSFVGHSFGARAVARAAELRGAELGGAILVDSAIAASQEKRSVEISENHRRYPTLAAALARFTLAPPQRCENLFILDEVARAGLVQDEDGWRWRFDPGFRHKLQLNDAWQSIQRPACPLGFIYGESSALVTEELLSAQRKRVAPGTPFIGIPMAGHHVMFDQPVALSVAIQSMMFTFNAYRGLSHPRLPI
jgi:pimeloyl-ACP methyl ester carboxylesterase